MAINKKKVLAVILARGGSKGIKLKNITNLSGHPLISYTLEAAKNSKYIDDILVSTDNKKIANIAKEYGAKVPFLREKELSGDRVSSVDALYDAVKRYQDLNDFYFDYIIELPCVCPFRGPKHIDEALFILNDNKKEKIDSVTAYVNTGEKHPTRLKRIEKNVISDFCKEYPEKNQISRRQDFEPSYIRNGSIYAMTNECLLKNKSRHGKKMKPYIMSQINSVNIDENFDLVLADSLIKNGYSINFPKKIVKTKIIKPKKKKKIKLLVTTNLEFIPFIKDKLKKNFECTFVENENNVSNLKRELKSIDGWICSPCPTYKINEKLLSDIKSIKFIITPSTGTTHIDLDYLKKRKIVVKSLKNTKMVNKIYASSEFTFLMLLSAFKNFYDGIANVKIGYWRQNEKKFRGNEISGKTLGIIGFGRIGSNVAKYALSMGMIVNFYDPYKKSNNSKIQKITNLYQMLKKSDAVVVSVHLNNETNNLMNKKFFSSIKKDAIIINSSRGEILKDSELIKFLKKNKKSKAVIDVIRNEQTEQIKDNQLYKYSKENNRLIITPHMAGLTFESETKAAIQTYDNLISVLKNKKL
jgi:phosphoglycerate dehydrogenase-like enzyme/CMP-N-acetylneuraminic acid synthetase